MNEFTPEAWKAALERAASGDMDAILALVMMAFDGGLGGLHRFAETVVRNMASPWPLPVGEGPADAAWDGINAMFSKGGRWWAEKVIAPLGPDPSPGQFVTRVGFKIKDAVRDAGRSEELASIRNGKWLEKESALERGPSAVDALLRRLEPITAALVELHVLVGWPVGRAAKKCGVPAAEARQRIDEGLRHLGRLVSGEEEQ